MGVCLIVEIVALAVFGLVDGHPFSYRRVQAERDEIQRAAPGSLAASVGKGAAVPEFLRSKSLHPYLGYVATPNRNGDSQDGTSPVTHFGFYDGNPILKRSPETVIVAIVGGSVAYGFGLDAPDDRRSGTEVLKERLKASPRFADKNITFLRLALSGYKQPQQLMTISYLLTLGAEFDVVINIDGFNEVALHPVENAATNTFAAYPRMWSFQTAGGRYLHSGKYQALQYQRRELADTFSCAPLKHSIVCNLVWKLRDRALDRDIYQTHQELLEDASGESSYEATGPYRRYANDDEMMDDLVAIWKRSSLQLDRLCRSNGIRYYHILQPNQYVPGSKAFTPAEREDAFDADHPYRHGAELGYPRLIAAGADLKQQGVRFFDLTQAFAREQGPIYTDTCCHFNERGYQILAEAIAGAIVSDVESQ